MRICNSFCIPPRDPGKYICLKTCIYLFIFFKLALTQLLIVMMVGCGNGDGGGYIEIVFVSVIEFVLLYF